MINDLEQLTSCAIAHINYQDKKVMLGAAAQRLLQLSDAKVSIAQLLDSFTNRGEIESEITSFLQSCEKDGAIDSVNELTLEGILSVDDDNRLAIKLLQLSQPFGGFKVALSIQANIDAKSASELRKVACYDSLTGLPNRLLFREQLDMSVKSSIRDGTSCAVISLELGDLRRIADAYGRQVSDEVVSVATQRLVAALRATDLIGREDLFASSGGLSRIEGYRFAIVLNRIKDPQDAARVARRLIETMSAPINTEAVEAYPPIWIGIALCPWDSKDPEMLASSANLALDTAMQSTNSRAIFYSASMNLKATNRLALESSLRRALDRREFMLYYQERVDLATGAIAGREALLRWNKPGEGVRGPGEFISVAEQSRLIVPLGQWILEEACAQNQQWIKQGLTPVPIAVNISAIQFGTQDFVTSVRRVLALTELDPSLLELEITESVIMDDAEVAIARIQELKSLGVLIALDDFGTGFSSLAYLRNFPADYLKIDRSFVQAATRDPKSAAICFAITDLAGRLGMGVIAEGVETQEEASLLSQQGVSLMQGFLFSVPKSAEMTAHHAVLRGRFPGRVQLANDLDQMYTRRLATRQGQAEDRTVTEGTF